MVGGDLICRKEDRNKVIFDGCSLFIFNAISESLDMKEITLTGRQYMWANNFNPTYI